MVDYNGLENRRTERYRGFESLSLRKSLLKEISEGFFIYTATISINPSFFIYSSFLIYPSFLINCLSILVFLSFLQLLIISFGRFE